MKTLLPLLVFLISFQPIISQVNTEFLRKSDLKNGFHNSIATNIGINAGNSQFINLKGGFRTDFVHNDLYIFLNSSIEYKEGKSAIISSKGFMHLRGNYSLSSFIDAEIFTQIEYDRFIKLNNRELFGTSLRLEAIHIRDSILRFGLFFGIGAMFEHENYYDDLLNTNLLRSTNYLSIYYMIRPELSFQAVTYLQFDVARFFDRRILSQGSLVINLFKGLKFTTNLIYRYDNNPLPEIKNYDLELNNGIIIEF